MWHVLVRPINLDRCMSRFVGLDCAHLVLGWFFYGTEGVHRTIEVAAIFIISFFLVCSVIFFLLYTMNYHTVWSTKKNFSSQQILTIHHFTLYTPCINQTLYRYVLRHVIFNLAHSLRPIKNKWYKMSHIIIL